MAIHIKPNGNNDHVITWDWLSKAMAVIILAGIPTMIGASFVAASRMARMETKLEVFVERQQALENHMNESDRSARYWRSPQDGQWHELIGRVADLDGRVTVLDEKVKWLRSPADKDWKTLERRVLDHDKTN